jgi:hypothetical protein
VKSNQRLELERFAEALEERGLVESATLQHILNQSFRTGELFTELLVREGLVSDWELARVSSELFGLPFLSVEHYVPSPDALAGLDVDFLNRYCIVPLDRFGKVLTVAIPAVVPADVLRTLGKRAGCSVIPVAGSVSANRNWLRAQFPEKRAVDGPQAALPAEADGDWADIFDAGDQAVQLDLREGDKKSRP